jgi:peptidoglycan hydrolase-like protein with peptidoglycan-binding domain
LCPTLSRDLAYGSRGSDVTRLQQLFSTYSIFSSANITGYFGPITRAAVQQWQTTHGIVSSGTPSTTGFGVLAPKTRKAIATCPAQSASAAPSSFIGGQGNLANALTALEQKLGI